MSKSLQALRAFSIVLALAMAASAEVRQWQVGGDDGLNWRDQALNTTAISFDASGAIRLVGFSPGDNIVGELPWTEGFPLDFVSELSQARVWDNVPFKQSNVPLIDGDPTTSSENRFKEFGVLQAGRTFFFDLGARFPVNRIVFFPRQEGEDVEGRPFSEDFIRSYNIQINNGTRFAPDSRPIYDLLSQVDFTRESIAETRFPLQFVRYIQLNVRSSNPFEIAEFQIFGAGFPPGGRYLSEIIDLGEVANFRNLHWTVEKLRQEGEELVAAEDADAEVSVRMRTGRDDTPQVFFEVVNVFTGDTQEVSEDAYGRLGANVRGPVEDDQTNWSFWSTPSTESGQPIDLPSPRRYFQFEISMESGAILDGLQVNSLTVEHSIPPLAQQLIGEISVLDDPQPPGNKPRVPAGAFNTFAYDIKTDIADTDVGFDALEISTPAKPVFRELSIGNPPVAVAPDSLVEEEGRLVLFFPSRRVVSQASGVLRVVFDAQVFVQATFFNAQAFDTQSDEAPQRVLPGDASAEVTTDNLRVLTSDASSRDLLPFFAVEPRIATPNGDGRNETAAINYTLVQLRRLVQVDVEIFDLGGRRIRHLSSGEVGSGSYSWPWDGRDDQGNLLPVGIYLARVSVDAERQQFTRTRTVGLVY